MGGAAGGYNIPVSLSDASGFSMPTNFNAPTVFNFGSPGSRFDFTSSQEANPVMPVTATSSAAEGNAGSSSSGSGVGTATSAIASLLTPTNLLIAGAVVALVIFFKYHH